MQTLYAIVDNERITQDPIDNQLRIFPSEHQAKGVLAGLQANGTLQQRNRRKNYTVQPVEVTIEQVVTTRKTLSAFTLPKAGVVGALAPAVPAIPAWAPRNRFDW